MIKMVRGYGPPPQDAGMDYAGYGVAARELPNPVSQMRPYPTARAQGLMRAVPALNGYSGCGCNQPGYGSPPVLRNQPADPTVITDTWGIDFTKDEKKGGGLALLVGGFFLTKLFGIW